MNYALRFMFLFVFLVNDGLFANHAHYCAFFNENKHKEFNFLSNFYEKSVKTSSGNFCCSEGYYQYQKFSYLGDAALSNLFLFADGQTAYELSRRYKDNIDLQFNKIAAMQKTLEAKFSDNELKEMLVATGNAYLVENCHFGHDAFWADNGDGSGQNMLGILIMQLREKLGGIGVVSMPEELKVYYAKRCEVCGSPCHFTNSHIVYNYCDKHMREVLKLGNVTTYIKPSGMPDGSASFLYFNLNEMPDFVEEGARLIAEHIQSLGLKNPFFVTPETSTMSMAHVLRTKYGINGVILTKQRKPGQDTVFSQEYCACTSLNKKQLYLPTSIDLKDKDVVIIDNVCTTGETLRAVYKLLCMAGVDSQRIVKGIVLFTEGQKTDAVKIFENLFLKIHSFGHIPILSKNSSCDKTLFKLYSSCKLPTHYGVTEFCVFKHRVLDIEAIVCLSPLTFLHGNKTNIPVRIHDACITSETFHSIKCDCQLQLDKALEYISEFGGMVIYLKQEGRGIGLGNKIAAYNLQETLALDTVEANRALDLPDDMREYVAARDIFDHFGIESVILMTNNPRKIECLEHLGIKIAGIIPCIVKPQSSQMKKYMTDKAKHMNHKIPLDKLVL